MAGYAIGCVSNFSGNGNFSRNISVLNSLHKFLGFVKIFLEQGDSFPSHLVKLHPVRIAIGGSFLAGVVLSIVYKSNNVYNIVQPRHYIPYTTLDELAKDKFSIYSRVTQVQYHLNRYAVEFYADPNKRPLLSRWTEVIFGKDDFAIFMATELHQHFRRKKYVFRNNGKNSDTTLYQLRKFSLASKLHKCVPKILSSSVDSLLTLIRSNLPNYRNLDVRSGSNGRWIFALSEYFSQSQQELIAENLKNCSKSAWILPWDEANKMSNLLQKSKLQSNVGTESYFDVDISLMFRGYVPASLTKDFSKMSESGIFGWWHDLVLQLIPKLENNDISPKTPNLNGNIIVIFTLLMSGVGLATIIFVGEIGLYIYQALRFIYYHIIEIIPKIYAAVLKLWFKTYVRRMNST